MLCVVSGSEGRLVRLATRSYLSCIWKEGVSEQCPCAPLRLQPQQEAQTTGEDLLLASCVLANYCFHDQQ